MKIRMLLYLLAAIADGLRAINSDTVVRAGLGADNVRRVRAFGKFVQGLAHANIAVLYDRGYRVDETVTTIDESGQAVLLGEPLTSQALMTQAIAYMDQAIAQATGQTWTIPESWMSVNVSSRSPARVTRSSGSKPEPSSATSMMRRSSRSSKLMST